MPLYEFHCKKCGKDSEVLAASSNWKGTKCPKCGSEQLVKKLSVFATTAASNDACGGGACDMASACPSAGPGGCCGGGMCGMN